MRRPDRRYRLGGFHAGTGPPQGPSPVVAPAEPEWSVADRVVVTAPSPRLWKLVKKTSTVSMLGEIEPMPKDPAWNSASLARIMQSANRVLYPPEEYGGVFNALSALARSRLPQGATLSATLPPPLYARYQAVPSRLGADPDRPRRDKAAWAALFPELDCIRAKGWPPPSRAGPSAGSRGNARQDQPGGAYKARGVIDELVSLPEAQTCTPTSSPAVVTSPASGPAAGGSHRRPPNAAKS